MFSPTEYYVEDSFYREVPDNILFSSTLPYFYFPSMLPFSYAPSSKVDVAIDDVSFANVLLLC
jgi:hypothetical protein